jgi:hypothetical protein
VLVCFGYLAKWLGDSGMSPGTQVTTILAILVALSFAAGWGLLRLAAHRYATIEL